MREVFSGTFEIASGHGSERREGNEQFQRVEFSRWENSTFPENIFRTLLVPRARLALATSAFSELRIYYLSYRGSSSALFYKLSRLNSMLLFVPYSRSGIYYQRITNLFRIHEFTSSCIRKFVTNS